MKINILIFFVCLQMGAQTLKINENKFVSIVFDSNIIQGAVGSKDYTFEYNPDGTENVALIKANKKDARETNLIVKTVNGMLYNINIEYGSEAKNIIKFNQSDGMNLNGSSSSISVSTVGPQNENTKNTTNTTNTTASTVKTNIRENDYTIGNTVINDAENSPKECTFCDKLLKVGKYIKRINSSNYGIKLDLENVCYLDSKLYISINIINKSSIDFNLNYIKSYVKQSKETASSNQYLEKNPVEIYNASRKIKSNSERKIIFIYDQFTIDENKSLVFELNEANGERNQMLFIPNYIINNPLHLK